MGKVRLKNGKLCKKNEYRSCRMRKTNKIDHRNYNKQNDTFQEKGSVKFYTYNLLIFLAI